MDKLSDLADYRDRKNYVKYNKGYVIYKLTNIVNGKVYIGLTSQIIKRIGNHIYLSKNPKNKSNKYIHKAISKYGLSSFTIEIVEMCKDLDDANRKEVEWIDKTSSTDSSKGYNLDSGGKVKKPSKTNTEVRRRNAKTVSVAQYDLDGKLIKTFYSVAEASRVLNINDTDIHRSHKRGYKVKQFLFKKFKDKPPQRIEPHTSKKGENFKTLYKGKLTHNARTCHAENLITGETFTEGSVLKLADKIGLHNTTVWRIIKKKNHKKWRITLQESL